MSTDLDLVQQAADIVVAAETAGGHVSVQGFGMHAGEADPPPAETRVLSAAPFTGVHDYEPANFTIGLGAGVPLAEARELLRAKGQEIPFDLGIGGTVGGLVARAPYSPRYSAGGGITPYVLGLEGVRGGGIPYRLGGMVVKNVAGYALWKFLVGSMGRAGLITRANFKLRPLPERRCLEIGGFAEEADAWATARALRVRGLDPVVVGILEGDARELLGAFGSASAGEVADYPWVVVCVVEGSTARATAAAAQAVTLLNEHRAAATARDDTAETEEFLSRLTKYAETTPRAECDGLVRLTVLPTQVAKAVRAVRATASGTWADGLSGVVAIRLTGSDTDLEADLTTVQNAGAKLRGNVRVVSVPPPLRANWPRDLTPHANGELVKAALRTFDPRGVFA